MYEAPHPLIREFTAKLGAKGWIGMDWPREYGGQGRSLVDQCIVIEELEWDGNNVIGRSKILDTRKGIDTRALIEAGVELGTSSRATGNLKKNKDNTFEVMTLNMRTYDLVSNPSNYDSFMKSIYEKVYGNDFLDGELNEEQEKLLQEELRRNNAFKLMTIFYKNLK